MSRNATCMYCGKRERIVNMQHLSDVDWIRTAVLSSLRMEHTADVLPSKPYLYADIINSANGFRRARYGALPTKVDRKRGSPPTLYKFRHAHIAGKALKASTRKYSQSRRMSERIMNNGRRSHQSTSSGSTELDDDYFNDPPPQLEISDTLERSAAFVLVEYFPPFDKNRQKYEVLLSDAGQSTKAAYLQEFDLRVDALRELLRLSHDSDKNFLANIPQIGVEQNNDASTSFDTLHLEPCELLQEAVQELGRIKALLYTALQNQVEILRHLNGSSARDVSAFHLHTYLSRQILAPSYTYCTEREVNSIFDYNPPISVARALSKKIFSTEEQALPVSKRDPEKVKWLKQSIRSKYQSNDTNSTFCVWASCKSALNKDAEFKTGNSRLPTPSKCPQIRPNLSEMPKLLVASQEDQSSATDTKPFLQPEAKLEDDDPPPLIDVYANDHSSVLT
uniref:Uncharacterized protein n=1 Tax=Ditylenchus dipsaci TaxID=166011 RepID=A0A915DXQ8_9BILA